MTTVRDLPDVKPILELSEEEIRNKFNSTYCRYTAHSIINYLCGKQNKFVEKPNSGKLFASTAFEPKDSMCSFLFDNNMDESIFLIEVGSDYHTFVIEKVLDDSGTPKCIIYQSWIHEFDLNWWLGRDSKEIVDVRLIQLRDKFGKGKKLNKEELNEFIYTIPKLARYHMNMGVVGSYRLITTATVNQNMPLSANFTTTSNQGIASTSQLANNPAILFPANNLIDAGKDISFSTPGSGQSNPQNSLI